ncbi:MAG: TatD family deoxyribonuclease [Nitrosomonas sp.]|nr:MAG: TatD family deoxyribonuclease [Nitrosomonas sp.]
MHCHLDLYSDPHQVAEICDQQGLYVLSVTTTPRAWDGTKKLAIGKKRIQTALGLHPQLAHQRSQELELFDQLLPKTKYVGEIGLDGSKEFKDHWQIQLQVFRHILKSVHRSGGRIMSIHSRASVNYVLDELAGIDGTAILHWFSGSKSELKRAIDLGCWFSVGPAMLSSKKGNELAALIPKNRLLSETDGPFAKIDGRAMMPWDVELVTLGLSKIWKVSDSDTNQQICNNFKMLLSDSEDL